MMGILSFVPTVLVVNKERGNKKVDLSNIDGPLGNFEKFHTKLALWVYRTLCKTPISYQVPYSSMSIVW